MSNTQPAMPSTPDAVVRSWFEELWNQKREDTIDRLFAVDGVAHGHLLPTVHPYGVVTHSDRSSGRSATHSRISESK